MIQLLYDIKRVYAESHMVVRLLIIHIFNRIDRCSEDENTTAMHFVNMVYDPANMDGVLYSVSEREAFILQDIIVAA
jgi:hypothetical protein